MIKVELSENMFEYDIQALCKAFYPLDKISFQIKGEENSSLNKKATEEIIFYVIVKYEKEKIRIEIKDSEKNIEFIKDCKTNQNDRRYYKNDLKRLLYQILCEKTNRTLPWGTLTGVRPSKLSMERLYLGETKEEIFDYMKEQYLCSEDKIELGYTVAKKEKELLEKIDYENGYSLYIGIPFCPTRCLYCSFTSYPLEKHKDWVEPYLEALFKEITYAKKCITDKKLTTVYIGGGTPTTLTAGQLERLLIKVRESFPMEQVHEFTVEAGRPDSITKEKLQVLKEQGVTRISINPQTMRQHTLDLIGRHHTVEDVERVFHMAREIGHNNINMDLIAGLPGENLEDMRYTLNRIKTLNPDSITVHSLVVKRAADLNLPDGRRLSESLGDTTDMLLLAQEFANKNQYKPYYMYRQKNTTGAGTSIQENVGYAKEGYEGIYNILIMEEKQTILALGAGASTKVMFPKEKRLERIENVKSLKEYIERIDEMIERKRSFFQA